MNVYEVSVLKGYNKTPIALNVLAKSAEQAASDASRHAKKQWYGDPEVVEVKKLLEVNVRYSGKAKRK